MRSLKGPRGPDGRDSYIPVASSDILGRVTKRLVDIDEEALVAAQAELGTSTMKETVNEALRRAAITRSARVNAALDRLGRRRLPPREDAWR